jgi:hypothetical protein
MIYEISDIVVVIGQKVKKIEFSEIIDTKQIYYMSDKTSYAEHQILRCANENEIQKFCEIEICQTVVNSLGKFVDSNQEYFENYFKEYVSDCKKYGIR